jgi:hypothetical protein
MSPIIPFRTTDQLQDGVRVLARFACNPAGIAPDWSNPRWVTLYVQRRPTAYKRRPAGELLTMTPKGEAWAEYRETDYDPHFQIFASK